MSHFVPCHSFSDINERGKIKQMLWTCRKSKQNNKIFMRFGELCTSWFLTPEVQLEARIHATWSIWTNQSPVSRSRDYLWTNERLVFVHSEKCLCLLSQGEGVLSWTLCHPPSHPGGLKVHSLWIHIKIKTLDIHHISIKQLDLKLLLKYFVFLFNFFSLPEHISRSEGVWHWQVSECVPDNSLTHPVFKTSNT